MNKINFQTNNSSDEIDMSRSQVNLRGNTYRLQISTISKSVIGYFDQRCRQNKAVYAGALEGTLTDDCH